MTNAADNNSYIFDWNMNQDFHRSADSTRATGSDLINMENDMRNGKFSNNTQMNVPEIDNQIVRQYTRKNDLKSNDTNLQEARMMSDASLFQGLCRTRNCSAYNSLCGQQINVLS